MAVRTVHKPAVMTKAMRIKHILRTGGPGKTRRYWRRMDIFVRVRLRL
jgi:hypothetical protein